MSPLRQKFLELGPPKIIDWRNRIRSFQKQRPSRRRLHRRVHIIVVAAAAAAAICIATWYFINIGIREIGRTIRNLGATHNTYY